MKLEIDLIKREIRRFGIECGDLVTKSDVKRIESVMESMKGLVDETCYGFGGGRFTAGFQDATRRNKKYKPETLKRVTWQSLGYRLGQEFGIMPDAWIHELKIILERYLAGITYASPWNPSNKG